MPILKACVEYVDGHPCGVLSPESRCPEHRRKHDKDIIEREPWRRLYKTWEWQRVVQKTLARDRYRCAFEVDGIRCEETEGLMVHHDRKLRTLWKEANGSWKRFVKTATDPRHLRSLCGPHHKKVDKSISEAEAALPSRRKSVSRARSRSTSARRRA